MKTRLDRLVENLEVIPVRVHRQIDAAMNDLPVMPSLISQWPEFEVFLANSFCHLENHILNVPARHGDMELHLARCHGLLKRLFGDSPMQTTFEMVRTGNEGGVYGLIRKIGEAFGREYAENMVQMTVESYWNHRTPVQLISDAQEYAEKFASLIPGELTEGSAARIKAQFRKLLNQHPWLVEKMRGNLRKR